MGLANELRNQRAVDDGGAKAEYIQVCMYVGMLHTWALKDAIDERCVVQRRTGGRRRG